MGRLLFVDKNPFGNLVDTYKYCQYLQKDFDITYVCIDYGYPKLDSGRVHVKYVPYTKSRTLRGILFSILSLYYVLVFKGFIFVSYFPGCDILKKLVFWKKMHVDIRTLSVSSDPIERERWNNSLKYSILKFDSISFISEGVRNMLGFSNNKKTFIVPLGADVISSSQKTFDKLNLLYVGTLNNRRIIDTVIGFHKFIKNHAGEDVHYYIIGDGEELERIKLYVEDNELGTFIETIGKLPYTELKPYFDHCNIGISYVPITDYYQYQPPTKTFEYISSGLYCLATSTAENSKIVKSANGILHDDSSNAFYEALESVYVNKDLLDSKTIRQSLKGCTWFDIVDKHLLPLINSAD